MENNNSENTQQQQPIVSHAKKFSLHILQKIKTTQLQNGLRHGDYQRYRHFCTRRVRRIRKGLKFLMGSRRKVSQKRSQLQLEKVNDVRYLELYLFYSERAWSYAMELKDDVENPRAKFHSLKRFKKAVKWANQLNKLCHEFADERTILEAESYCSWTHGNLFLEIEDWKKARDEFIKARHVYEELSKVGSLENQTLCKQRVEEIEPSIRFCLYNLREKTEGEDYNALISMTTKNEGSGLDHIKQKLESVVRFSNEKSDSLRDVTWKGQIIPITNEKLRLCLIDIIETTSDLDKVQTEAEKLPFFDKIFMKYTEAQKIVKEDKEITAMTKNPLLEYLKATALNKTVDRNLLLVRLTESKIDFQELEPNVRRKQTTKPDEIVRLYEILLQNLSELKELYGEADLSMSKNLSDRELTFKALRCFYLATSHAKSGKWNHAIALLDRCDVRIREAMGSSPSQTTADVLKELQRRSNASSLYVNARAFLESQKLEKEEKSDKASDNLLTRLDSYDATFLEKKKLVDFPPSYQIIHCKPILFDVAIESCSFPSLEHKKTPAKKGGWFSFLTRT
eukprot:TRINITY_DN8860_c0_g1_i4.p1 TRINITY_DN8860_c0_g1~~TRINITY_DN8860_c0_g1_i4.p1  ORF type:complete len:567 (-),score=108.89 TRINITY_DN8860_c0_g1_i4:99-1799(-)